MLLLVSAVIVLVYTAIFCIGTKKKSRSVSNASAKCVAMSYGMITGTTIGLFIGIYLQGELAYSTVASIVISAILSYFAGRIFGLAGIIEALASGFMGSMMGAMLGEMIDPSNQAFMVIVMVVLYSLVVTGLQYMILSEHQKTFNTSKIKAAPLFVTLLLSFSSISVVASVDKAENDDGKTETVDSVEHQHQHHH